MPPPSRAKWKGKNADREPHMFLWKPKRLANSRRSQTFETTSSSTALVHKNSSTPNIDNAVASSDSGSCSGESEDREEKHVYRPRAQEPIPGAFYERSDKQRLRNEKKHQRQKEKRAMELHERCRKRIISRKLDSGVEQLVAMGFTHERSTAALLRNEGKLEQAIAWLIERDDDDQEHEGSLEIDIEEELQRMSEMELEFKRSKQQVERAVVFHEGDLEKVAEVFRSSKNARSDEENDADHNLTRESVNIVKALPDSTPIEKEDMFAISPLTIRHDSDEILTRVPSNLDVARVRPAIVDERWAVDNDTLDFYDSIRNWVNAWQRPFPGMGNVDYKRLAIGDVSIHSAPHTTVDESIHSASLRDGRARPAASHRDGNARPAASFRDESARPAASLRDGSPRAAASLSDGSHRAAASLRDGSARAAASFRYASARTAASLRYASARPAPIGQGRGRPASLRDESARPTSLRYASARPAALRDESARPAAIGEGRNRHALSTGTLPDLDLNVLFQQARRQGPHISIGDNSSTTMSTWRLSGNLADDYQEIDWTYNTPPSVSGLSGARVTPQRNVLQGLRTSPAVLRSHFGSRDASRVPPGFLPL